MKASLYDRLGGFDGISAIVNDVVERRLVNPLIKTPFANSDIARLKKSALAAHKSLNGVGAEEQGPNRSSLKGGWVNLL